MHFLTSHIQRSFLRPEPYGRPRAAVRARWNKREGLLVLVPHEEPIVVLKADAMLFPLPEEMRVAAPDGKILRPTGKFWITTETIDPIHLITDVF